MIKQISKRERELRGDVGLNNQEGIALFSVIVLVQTGVTTTESKVRKKSTVRSRLNNSWGREVNGCLAMERCPLQVFKKVMGIVLPVMRSKCKGSTSSRQVEMK